RVVGGDPNGAVANKFGPPKGREARKKARERLGLDLARVRELVAAIDTHRKDLFRGNSEEAFKAKNRIASLTRRLTGVMARGNYDFDVAVAEELATELEKRLSKYFRNGEFARAARAANDEDSARLFDKERTLLEEDAWERPGDLRKRLKRLRP